MTDGQKKLTISVILVTYNRAEMLKDALSSLVGQVRVPDEVVVVDNGSTDHTKEIVRGFEGRLAVKYLFENKRGIPFARNAGVMNSSGDLIVFTDDDCVADKEWLHFLELPFLRDPSIGMVGGEILACRTKGTLIEDYCIADALMRVGSGSKKDHTP
jgi:glycosyltransferase involved in cell wall biosynthesis